MFQFLSSGTLFDYALQSQGEGLPPRGQQGRCSRTLVRVTQKLKTAGPRQVWFPSVLPVV